MDPARQAADGQLDVEVVAGQPGDGGDDRGRPACEHLGDGPRADARHQVVEGDPLLGHVHAVVAQQAQDRAARAPLQDDAGQLRGPHAPVGHDDEHVHPTQLLEVLLLVGVQEAHLGEAPPLRLDLGEQRRRVVAARLRAPGAPRARPVVPAHHPDRHAGETAREVRAGRRPDDVVVDDACGVDAHELLRGEHEGAQVEGGPVHAGHPLLVGAHVVHQGRHEVPAVDLGQGEAVGRVVDAGGVVARAEGPDGPVGVPVGLDALEHRLAVVEHRGPRGQGQRPVGHDPAVLPPPVPGPPHVGHVVGEFAPEGQLPHDVGVLLLRGGGRVGGQREAPGQLVGCGQRLVRRCLEHRGGVLRRCHGASCCRCARVRSQGMPPSALWRAHFGMWPTTGRPCGGSHVRSGSQGTVRAALPPSGCDRRMTRRPIP